MSRTSFDAVIRELRSLRDGGSPMYAVHYACANFYKTPDQPPAVSVVAFAEVFASNVIIYSVVDREKDGERYVLESFFRFLREHEDARLVHWNMNSADFGFRALENRYARLIGVEPSVKHSQGRLIDLDELIALGYGHDFADHPRLASIAGLNQFTMQNFLSGKEEADHFDKGQHAIIRRSTNEKVRLLCFLTKRLVDGMLETRHGGQRLEFAGSSIDSVALVVTIGTRMLDVQRQLALRHDKRPTLTVADEYDAQDLFNSLLRVFFDDIRREEWTPSYAAKSARIDFVLPRSKLGVELKYARGSMTAKSLSDELIVDIER
jgi:REase_DpnII-MboI